MLNEFLMNLSVRAKVWVMRNEKGASAIEYALIASVIGIGILASMEGVRDAISDLFASISGKLASTK